jgi:hypothetical protein
MPQNAAPATAEPEDGLVLATLGKQTIHYGDFTRWLKLMAGPRAEMVRRNPAVRAMAQKQYLEQLVLAAKGRRENLQNTAEFKSLHAALEMECYARILMDVDRPGSDAQKLKTQAENPSEEEVQAYFKANGDRYAAPEKFSARHILVSLKGAGGKPLTDEEAKVKVAKIQEALKAGRKLEDLTKEFSDDAATKDKGGLVQDIPYGRFAHEFEEAVRKQDIGLVGEPVKTPFGYHLIQVLARTPKQPADFEKVKDTVKTQMIPERRERLNREFIEGIKKEVGYQDAAPATPKPAAGPQAPAPKAN